MLPDGKLLYQLSWVSEAVFPSGWLYFPCNLNVHPDPDEGGLYDFAVRLFTELGARDYPFRVRFVKDS